MGSVYNHSPRSKKTINALWRLLKIILESLDFNIVIQKIVDSVLLELGYLRLGYEIVVLCLVDEKKKVLQRISISQTDKAQQALLETPVPFHEITIPLHYSRNLLIKALREKKSQIATSWPDILMPAFTRADALRIQRRLGIQASLIYPVLVKNEATGALIFSMSKPPEKVTPDERDLIRSFSDIVGLAVQNASLYSQIEDANLSLKRTYRQLKHLDKLKDEFVFIAAHELKNPVTAIRGYLYMLQKQMYGGIPAKLKEPIEQLNTSNQQLVQLVNDLLQIARAEAKTITIRTEPVNLCQVVDETIASLKPLAQQKKLALVHDCQEEQRVMADANRLTEILNNLISNSIKYSDKGTIRVSHSVEQTQVVTHVADQGVGIDKEDQEKIFTRFFRSAEEKVKGIPGTGLGLFIVKQLVDKMKGEIWFTSEKGQGTVFSFSLPKSSRS